MINHSFSNEILVQKTPIIMSQVDLIYEQSGPIGVIFHYVLVSLMIALLILIRWYIYRWDRENKGREFFSLFLKNSEKNDDGEDR